MRANRRIGLSSVILIVLAVVAVPTARAANQYDATFYIQPNGDVKVDMTFTLPMTEYTQLRSNLPMLHLLLRDLASERSDIEVRDRDAKYNDAERSVDFTMRALGGAKNMGDNWEFEVDEDRVFSNLNESEKTMYFTPNIEGEMGSFQGQERLVLPTEATQIEWDKGKRLITYVMPVPAGPSAPGKPVLWCLAAVFIVAGAALLAMSSRAAAAAGTKEDE